MKRRHRREQRPKPDSTRRPLAGAGGTSLAIHFVQKPFIARYLLPPVS